MKGNTYFVNEFDLNTKTIDFVNENGHLPKVEKLDVGDLSLNIHKLFTKEEIKKVNDQLDRESWIPVGIDGIQSHYKDGDVIGSYRLSCYETILAEAIFNRLKPYLPEIRVMNEDSPTDWDGHKYWQPIGINPLFRFIRYTENGLLIPHYDGPFVQNDNVRSLSTLVIYLTDNESGGTRFIKDEQKNLPLNERNYDDWTLVASDKQVELKVEPQGGDAILFDHRILHDSEKIKSNEIKTIIRTDIMYRRV